MKLKYDVSRARSCEAHARPQEERRSAGGHTRPPHLAGTEESGEKQRRLTRQSPRADSSRQICNHDQQGDSRGECQGKTGSTTSKAEGTQTLNHQQRQTS